MIKLIEEKVISSTSGKEVAQALLQHGGTAMEIVERLNLAQVSDEESIAAVLSPIVAANQSKVEAIAQGRTQLAGFYWASDETDAECKSPSGEASCVPSVRIIRLSENDLTALSPTPLKSPSIDSTA